MDACAGGDKHRRYALVDGRAVHIDCRAQGQDESGDIILGAQLMGALFGNRQSRRRRRGGKGKNHGGEGALEKLDGTHAHKDLSGHGIDQHRVDNIADVCAENHQEERTQNSRALGSGHPRHVGEHAHRRQGDHELHQPLNNRVERTDHVPAELAFLPSHHNGSAEEQGNYNDLEHVGIDKGAPHVAGENVHQHGHEAVKRLGLVLRRAQLRGEVGEQARTHEDVGKHQTDHTGDRGGDQEVSYGLDSHGANLLHVAHGEDAVNHAQQHYGYYNELQQVHEDVAEGLQIRRSEVRPSGEIADQAHSNTGKERNQDPYGQAVFLLHTLTS